MRTAGGGRVGKREEGRRGGRGAPGNGPRPRRPLKGPLRAPGPDSKANGRPPASLPAPAGAGAEDLGCPGPCGRGRAPAGGERGGRLGKSGRGRCGSGWGQPWLSSSHRQVELGPQTAGGSPAAWSLSPIHIRPAQGARGQSCPPCSQPKERGAPKYFSKGWWYSQDWAGGLEDFLEEVTYKLGLAGSGAAGAGV